MQTAAPCSGAVTLGRLARRAAIPLALLAFAPALAAQIREVKQPSPAEVAAAQRRLRRVEASYLRRLERRHGDPETGKKLGEVLRKIPGRRLDHPSAAIRAAVAAARDPAALALAIAAKDSASVGYVFGAPVTYETDVLLTALSVPASAPRQAELWARAAAIQRDDVALRITCLERAFQGVGAHFPPDDTPGGTPPDPISLNSLALDDLLAAGLAHEAVAFFDSLPWNISSILLEYGGSRSAEGYIRNDQRLSLVAARILDGDPSGARDLLARIPIKAWSPSDGSLTKSTADRDLESVWRALLERSLAPAGGEDAFSLLAEFAAVAMFGPSVGFRGVGVTAYARLAEREGYPEIAAFAWRRAGGTETGGEPLDPELLPPAAAQTLHKLRAAVAERARTARTALAANREAAAKTPRPVAWAEHERVRLDLNVDAIPLFALDRSGKRGIAIVEAGWHGEVYRLEARESGLVGVQVNWWIG
jgi:hypothetical protein